MIFRYLSIKHNQLNRINQSPARRFPKCAPQKNLIVPHRVSDIYIPSHPRGIIESCRAILRIPAGLSLLLLYTAAYESDEDGGSRFALCRVGPKCRPRSRSSLTPPPPMIELELPQLLEAGYIIYIGIHREREGRESERVIQSLLRARARQGFVDQRLQWHLLQISI